MSGVTYFLQTFGCKSNQYESQAIREALTARGHDEREHPADAAVLVLNTCGVTGRAGASCRNAVRKALRANPAIRLVITGCGVDLGERWPETERPPLLVPNARKHAIADCLDAIAREQMPTPVMDDRFALSISRFDGHTRAFLKIQDGCDNFCSYCAVPFARGKPESRPYQEILDEAARLAASGHKEIVLTGINIGAYQDGGITLAELIKRLADTPGLLRLRLGSVEPPHVTPALAAAMAGSAAICPHIHIPLQSGDDRILAAMGRRYTAREFLDKVEMIRGRLAHPAVTTDVIVGFPGENAESAGASVDLCRAARLARLHVFLFSPRPGTAAATMRRTADDRQVEEWKSHLIETGGELARVFAQGCVGMQERVLAERSGTGLSDRYITVRLPEPFPAGTVIPVTITGTDGPNAIAVPIRDEDPKRIR